MAVSKPPLDEADEQRAMDESAVWVDEYLDRVPFEAIYRALCEHALRQLVLALGPRHGPQAASSVLRTMIEPTALLTSRGDDIEHRLQQGDVTLLRDDDLDIDWQDIAADFASLFAFARYGHGNQTDPAMSAAEITGVLRHFRAVVGDASIAVTLGPLFEWLGDMLRAAEARWAIDHGMPVVPDNLAALAGVKSKTITNLLTAREMPTDGEGCIPAAEALRYLERRGGFVRSSWQYRAGHVEPEESAPLSAQVFVPVDKDGNPFLPSLARPGRDGIGRYAIGPKKSPEYIEDYWAALDRLARMSEPRWRRPPASSKGGWSLVTAQDGWRRFPRSDIERMIVGSRAKRMPE